MRTPLVLSAAIIAASGVLAISAAPAAADQATDVANAFTDGTAATLFAAKLTLEGVEFTDEACDQAFGLGKRRVVAKKQHAKLAACLAPIGWRALAERRTVGAKGKTIVLSAGFGVGFDVRLVPGKGGQPKITTMTMWVEVEDEGDVNGTLDGVEGGIEGGIAGGIEGGVVGGDVPPPPPPPAKGPQIVSPTALEPSRIAGDKNITPDESTKEAIAKSGKAKLVAVFKLCVDTAGKVSAVTKIKSSGFPAYDTRLEAGIKTWKYKPFLVNGKAAPVCTAVSFIYAQK